MKLVSTTLTNERPHVIADALRAARRYVDASVLIWTGPGDAGASPTVAAARAAVPDLLVESWPWQDDFAAARNASLEFARAHGADWALTADSDETLEMGAPEQCRVLVASCPADAVIVPIEGGGFGHARWIRLAPRANGTLPRPQWDGMVHEMLLGPESYARAPATAGGTPWCFRPLPRPEEDLTAKFSYYRDLCERETRRRPKSPRHWYYLGDSHHALGAYRSALGAWGRRLRFAPETGSIHEGAWAGWRGALTALEHPDLGERPEEWVIRGLRQDPEHTELWWLLGHLALSRGDLEQAEKFAQRAVDLGPRERGGGFAAPTCQTEMPRNLLAHVQHQRAAVQE